MIAHLRSIRNVEWIWALLGSLVMWLVLGAFARSVSLESLIATSTTAAFLAIVALGQMVVITTGRGAIDLSIPGVITLAAYLATGLGGGSNARLLLVFPLVLAIGAAIGVANALTVLFLRIPPIIATLGMATSSPPSSSSITPSTARPTWPPSSSTWPGTASSARCP